MIHFNGGTVSLGTSISPLGAYAGYLLLNSGNVWLAAAFFALTFVYFLVAAAMLCRFVVNYRRNAHFLRKKLA